MKCKNFTSSWGGLLTTNETIKLTNLVNNHSKRLASVEKIELYKSLIDEILNNDELSI